MAAADRSVVVSIMNPVDVDIEVKVDMEGEEGKGEASSLSIESRVRFSNGIPVAGDG